MKIRNIKGLFIDRHLNLKVDEYELLKGEKIDIYT
jgi:hypothetical protein